MLRPIPENESDAGGDLGHDHHHPGISLDAASAVAAVPSDDGVLSDASAVLADGTQGDRDGLIKNHSSKNRKDRIKRAKRYRRRRRWAAWRSLVVYGIVISCAVLIVVLVLATTDGPVDEFVGNSSIVPTVSPTIATPTASPTIDVETVASLDALVDEILLPIPDNTDSEIVTILTEARTMARNWILRDDLLRDEVLADPTGVRFTQRYVLILLALSLQFNQNNLADVQDSLFPVETPECEWPGIYCDEAVVEETDATTITLPVVRRIQWGGRGAIGALPGELQKLSFLQELDLSFNSIQGTIPGEWFERVTLPTEENEASTYFMPYFYLLDLSHNLLEGSIQSSLFTLPSLRFLYLSNNTLTGELPTTQFFTDSEKEPSQYLQDIWLDNNSLEGALDSWLFLLANGRQLVAERNGFQSLPDFDLCCGGAIADSFQTLDLSRNSIAGTLPSAIFQGPSVTFIYLDNNLFSGALPNLTYPASNSSLIIDVWLHDNQLNGVIPDSFGADWQQLTELSLHNNNLEGALFPGCDTAAVGPIDW